MLDVSESNNDQRRAEAEANQLAAQLERDRRSFTTLMMQQTTALPPI